MYQKKILSGFINSFFYFLPAGLIFLISTFFCHAQTAKDTLVANKISKLQKVFHNYQQLTTSKIQQGYLENAKKVFSNAQPSSTDAPYQNAVKKAELEKLKRNAGLEFNSNYLQNFETGAGEEDIIYRQRIQAGIDWNILKGGLFENTNKAKQAELQMAINNLNARQDKKQQEISARHAQVIYKFNIEKIRLLKKRKEILDEKTDLINSLHDLKEITNLEFIHFKQSLIDIKSALDIYENFNIIFKEQFTTDSSEAFTLPLIDFDFASFLKDYAALGALEDSILKLSIKALELQQSVNHKMNLKASLRYNYYDAFYSETARNFMSAGLSFSIPIGGGDGKQLTAAKTEMIKHKLTSGNREQLAEMMSNFYEFRFKLKQYLDLYEKNAEWAELLRIERVRMQYTDAEFNPVKSLKLLDEFLDQRIELLDVKQQLYLKLIQLNKYNPTANMQDYISLVELDSLEQNAMKFSFSKSVYVWAHAFENNNINFVSEFLIKNDVDNAIISAGNDLVKALGRMDTLAKSNISSELLIGDNSIIGKTPAQLQEYFNALFTYTGKPKFNALHLDVEPHTFDDWQQNKTNYYRKYRTMLQVAYKICEQKKIKLNVSVPVNYDLSLIQDIEDYCNRIYVMAYENRKTDYVTRKLKENFAPVKDKVVIVLRTEDFSSSTDMNQYMKIIADKTDINKFAIHDLTRLIKLPD